MRSWEKIHRQVKELIQDKVVSGASYGFVKDGELFPFYQGFQGAVEPWASRKLEPGMLYDLASVTKVTGTSPRILQMIQEGTLDFATPVRSVLERFSDSKVTVGNLLLHDSGLPAEMPDKYSLTADLIRDRLYEIFPEAEPGERYCYSDPGFMLLGLIVEEIDGASLEESFCRHIFEPLGMRNTSFHPRGEISRFVPEEYSESRGWICGEVHDSKAYLMGESGSAGLFSSLDDMLRYVSAWLVRDERLLSRKLFEAVEKTEHFGRTYGWAKDYGPGTLYHTGFTGTSVLIDMEAEEGFVLLTNRVHPSRDNEEFLKRRQQLNEQWLSSGCIRKRT